MQKDDHFRLRVLRVSTALLVLLIAGCTEPAPTFEESFKAAEAKLAAEDVAAVKQGIIDMEALQKQFPERTEVVEALAFAYAQQDDHMNAALQFIELAQNDEGNSEYRKFAAQSLIDGDDPKGAAREYEAYLKINGEDAAAWKTLGQLREDLESWNAAADAYIRTFQIKPDGDTAFRLASIFDRLENRDQTHYWLNQVLTVGKGGEDMALLGFLDLALREKDYEAAEKRIAELDAQFPGRLDQSPLAPKRAQIKRWRALKDERENMLAENAARAREERERAEAALANGDTVTADARDATAGDADPEDTTVSVDTPADNGEFIVENATATGEETGLDGDATETDTTDVGTTDEPEVTADATGVVEEAAMDASAAEPGDIPAARIVIDENTDGGELLASTAEPEVRSLPPTPPGETRYQQLSAARAQLEQANYDGAIQAYRSMLAQDDSSAQVWYELSEAYRRKKEYRLAEAMAQMAITKAPERVLYTLQYLKIGQNTRSPQAFFQELHKAKLRFPDSPEVTLSLARGYVNVMRNYRNAALLYREFLQMAPDHPLRPEAEAELRTVEGQ